jgi:hypothetical protein
MYVYYVYIYIYIYTHNLYDIYLCTEDVPELLSRYYNLCVATEELLVLNNDLENLIYICLYTYAYVQYIYILSTYT